MISERVAVAFVDFGNKFVQLLVECLVILEGVSFSGLEFFRTGCGSAFYVVFDRRFCLFLFELSPKF